MINLVVFDWNGTLFDDTHVCVDAENHVLKIFGGRQIDLKIFRDTITMPVIDFYVQHGCDREQLIREVKKLGQIFIEYYEEHAKACSLRADAKELLEWLFEKEIDMVILSNHTVSGIKFQLERFGISKYFKDVLANEGAETSMKVKNKAEKLKEYMKGYNNAVIIGDGPEEAEIAKKLGITSILITGGYFSDERVEARKPDHIISNLCQLKERFLN